MSTQSSPAAVPGRLALADGSVFHGVAFGATGRRLCTAAEVVFNTAMTGYQEALTDPSYTGQILVMTSPMIGNYGINGQDVESVKVQVAGMVVRELSRVHSNFRAEMSLHEYLSRAGVLGLSEVDTRALTRRLRTGGAMSGVITDDASISDAELVARAKAAPSMAGQNLVPAVGCTSGQKWTETLGQWSLREQLPGVGVDGVIRGVKAAASGSAERPLRVLALDCGAKANILRNLTDRGCEVELVPHTISAAEIIERFDSGRADGLFISNGPGDPAAVEKTIATLREVISQPKTMPTFGICLGHQLLALAAGGKTYKLKFGHRGANQPILNTQTGRVEITSQNHGFAVDPASIQPVGGVATHIHLNDQTLAGFRLKDKPVFSVQYHPEASPGPHDSSYLFDDFVEAMAARRAEGR